ncbi:MBL fold metallo-hydrolase [Salinirubellus salinus]|uniref:MBL fold metallo-hydrolase n=1 Tax=Salinirubellus salinus TaxID=1364945 RepID=A0A9E7R4R5_9EURY|nr:MBL fold metallo-hydrolase [Salinirubellus salinus]UWM55850.1 MBL fold metallo-hydrolase [Salinirubellus salinus]
MQYERFEFQQPEWGEVNVLRVGDTLVDTGHVAPVSRDAVREAVEDGPLAGVERVLHTHPHIDHVGGSQTVDALAELPHLVPAGAVDLLYGYTDYLRRAREEMTRLLAGFGATDSQWDRYFPIESYAEERIEVTRELTDGDTVELGGESLTVVSTPGHADPHLAFHHEPSGTLFSGDLVDPSGRFQYGPLLGDVGAYVESLRRVRALDPDVLVPMHGPAMDDPDARIERALADVERTVDRLLTHRADGPFLVREFVVEELGIDDFRVGYVTLTMYEYLRYLERRGECTVRVADDGIHVE